MASKTAHCPTCSPATSPGKARHHAAYSDSDSPVWSCGNCGHESPRRIRRSKFNVIVARMRAGRLTDADRAWMSKRYSGQT